MLHLVWSSLQTLLLCLMPWIDLRLYLQSRKDSSSNSKSSYSLISCEVKVGHNDVKFPPQLRTFHTYLQITKKKSESSFLGYFIICDKILPLREEERHSDAEAWGQTALDTNVFPLDLSSMTWGIRCYKRGELQEIVLIDSLSSKLYEAGLQNVNLSGKSFKN